MAEGLLGKQSGFAVDRLAGEGELFEEIGVLRGRAAVAHHPVVRRCRGQIGELVIVERLEHPLRVEPARECPDRESEREWRERTVPQPMTPGRR